MTSSTSPRNRWDRRGENRVETLPTRYRSKVSTVYADTPETSPAASVVLVTYRTSREDMEAALSALERQTVEEFEVVVVDNGNEWPVEEFVRQFDHVSLFAGLKRNMGVTFGRNLGARLAASDLVVFLDDDGVPGEEFVEAHCAAHEGRVVGVRGRVVPQHDSLYNRRQSWYDLGDEPIPFHLNTEGNCSYDREAFLSVDGFEEQLEGRAGHEGTELTYRLINEGGYDREQFIYHPDPIIYHDVASDALSYLKKRIYKEYNHQRLSEWHPELREFLEGYSIPAVDRNRLEIHEVVLVALMDRIVRLGCVGVGLKERLRHLQPWTWG